MAFRLPVRRRELRDLSGGALWHYCRETDVEAPDVMPLTPAESRQLQNQWRHIE
jgi:hypothetical protein